MPYIRCSLVYVQPLWPYGKWKLTCDNLALNERRLTFFWPRVKEYIQMVCGAAVQYISSLLVHCNFLFVHTFTCLGTSTSYLQLLTWKDNILIFCSIIICCFILFIFMYYILYLIFLLFQWVECVILPIITYQVMLFLYHL